MNVGGIVNNSRYMKRFGWVCFIFWIALFYQKIHVFSKLDDRPCGEHIWAQIDRASMALTYYKDDAPFLLPRCHQAHKNPEGITAGEFPLIPYTVSRLYAWFGFHEIYHRMFVWFWSLAGFVAGFLLARRLTGSYVAASVVSALCLVSFNIIFYSISFLPEVPALGCIFFAVYFLCRNKEKPTNADLVFFSLFFALAALIRVSSALVVLSVSFAYVLAYWSTRLQGSTRKLQLAIALIVPVISAVVWILYARSVVAKYHIFTFMMQPSLPDSMDQFKAGIGHFIRHIGLFYMPHFFWFLGITTLIGLVFIRRSDKFLGMAALFTYLSFIFLFVLLFKKGFEHSYYWVPFEIAVFFHLAWLMHLALQVKLNPYLQITALGGLFVFINYNALHVEKNFDRRWNPEPMKYAAYYDLEPYLDSLNITYHDRVLTYDDPTFNNTLYLMDRKGWSLDKDEDPASFYKAVATCKYGIVSDTSLFAIPGIRPHFTRLMGTHKGLMIYQVEPQGY